MSATNVDPTKMVPDGDPRDGLLPEPPPISGYRKADVAGVACWNCAHFCPTGDPDNDGDIDGICNLFEAQADGVYTCDRFTAHADLFRQSPHTSWTEDMQDLLSRGDPSMGPSAMSADYSDSSILNSITFASEEATEEDGLVWKDILRTGSWAKTPTANGMLDKSLQIVRDGQSDPANGIISLAELYQNFNERVVPYVTVPLSDDEKDHKNIARLNTGFVRKLKVVDRDDGMSVLQAGIDFTEPDVKGKVLRGTIPDVSAGVPYFVTRRSDNRTFNTVLDHVCLTRKPYVDNLTPFGISAADSDAEIPVEAWEPEADPATSSSREKPPESSDAPAPLNVQVMSFREQEQALLNAIRDQLRLGPEYTIEDVVEDTEGKKRSTTVAHSGSGALWNVPFRLTGDSEKPVIIASVENWKMIEEPKQTPPETEAETKPEPEPEQVAASDSQSALRRARELRELRLSQPPSDTGGIQMTDLLDGVELSDEARSRVKGIIEDNAKLRRQTREGDVDKRITELEGLGLKDRPGALKLYRSVMLSDDGGPAIILFSDSGDEKEKLTTVEVLDRFIDALKGENGVELSDQHLASANDNKPPATPEGERKPLDERVDESRKALYGEKRTGRK